MILHWKLEILDEVHQWNLVIPLEECWEPENMHTFQSPGEALEQSTKHTQIVFFDCSLFPIG
jgi:hypothetical protein